MEYLVSTWYKWGKLLFFEGKVGHRRYIRTQIYLIIADIPVYAEITSTKTKDTYFHSQKPRKRREKPPSGSFPLNIYTSSP